MSDNVNEHSLNAQYAVLDDVSASMDDQRESNTADQIDNEVLKLLSKQPARRNFPKVTPS
ncbi:MAG: hypothetical protein ABJX32_19610 [Tateyamaria sp.]|uniref:hypothetical protein n=1 Tax=Tateyamaria sp. TaxID=1929288 RepID=UPI00329A8F03